jgi:hypothetical protein
MFYLITRPKGNKAMSDAKQKMTAEDVQAEISGILSAMLRAGELIKAEPGSKVSARAFQALKSARAELEKAAA